MARRLLQITLLLSALGAAIVAQQPAPATPSPAPTAASQPAPPKTHFEGRPGRTRLHAYGHDRQSREA